MDGLRINMPNSRREQATTLGARTFTVSQTFEGEQQEWMWSEQTTPEVGRLWDAHAWIKNGGFC